VREKHFRGGDLKLKCTATIATIYWKSNEESVQGVGRPQSALVSESRSSRNTLGGTEEGDGSEFIFVVFLMLSMCWKELGVLFDSSCANTAKAAMVERESDRP
jgi:hypothetical protein